MIKEKSATVILNAMSARQLNVEISELILEKSAMEVPDAINVLKLNVETIELT